MPLYLAIKNQDFMIIRITGNDKIRNHLKTIGFVIGETVKIVNHVDENVIVKIKGVSVALSHELAKRIYVSGGENDIK